MSMCEATAPVNVWCGAIRSGKTYASIYKLIDFLKNGPKGDAMIVGVSRGTIQRNVLRDLYKALGYLPPAPTLNKGVIFGRDVFFVGASDISSVSTILGSTLAAAYVDEVARIPQHCWKTLLGRMSVEGARVFATCNPEGPAHWFKKDVIDKAIQRGHKYWTFLMEDNPSLSPEYVKRMKSEYTGMWYDRYILGKWAVAHGLIYDAWDNDNLLDHKKNNPSYYICGIDYGTSNATAAVLCAVNTSQWPQLHVEAEYYYDSSQKGRSQTDAELVTDLQKFLSAYPVRSIYVDPSAASLKAEMHRRDMPAEDAVNDVLPGIGLVSRLIHQKMLVVHPKCTNLIDSIRSYAWDAKYADLGIDKPEKKSDHACDALRYCVYSAFPRGLYSGDTDYELAQEHKRYALQDLGFWKNF